MNNKTKMNIILGTLEKRVPKIKNNKGVSLIALIITIIVILILTGITIHNFNKSSERATTSKILNEFIEVENAVAILGKMHNMDSSVHVYIGQPLSKDFPLIVNNKEYGDGYYYLKEKDLIQLGVNSTSRNYIVNYVTEEVVATEPYTVDNRQVYTKSDLINVETDNSVVGIAEYDSAKGVNKPVLFRGMVPVKYSNGSWVVCDVNDNEWYDYSVTSEGPVRYANVMLMDDITLTNPSTGAYLTNENVRGSKLNELVGCTVTTQGSMFVWVPRYTYKDVDGNIQIIYSYLTQDYLINGFVKSPAFYNGEYQGATDENENAGYIANGKELTGIWISKYQAGYAE